MLNNCRYNSGVWLIIYRLLKGYTVFLFLAYFISCSTFQLCHLDRTHRLLLWNDIETFIHKFNFYYAGENDDGTFTNQFKTKGRHLVYDAATGLLWQRSGSDSIMPIKKAHDYIDVLNKTNYQGFSDWRLPSLEELCSLLEKKKSGRLHIDPVFNPEQVFCWSGNISSKGYYWGVLFTQGVAYSFQEEFYVRAVRSGP